MDHVTALPCLLLGLEGFRLLAATEHGHELVLLVETTADRDFCRTCGVRAGSKGRARTTVRDVPIAGRPTVLVWRNRIWRCEQSACEAGSWREQVDAIRPRAVLTERARGWAVRQVGRDALSVAQVARELGVGWHTIMAAVHELGGRLLVADDRLEDVVALGLDEHNFLRDSFRAPTSWVTAFVDLDAGRLLATPTRATPRPSSASCPKRRWWSITSTSSGSATLWSTRSAVASSKTPSATAAARATRSTTSARRCWSAVTGSPTTRTSGSTEPGATATRGTRSRLPGVAANCSATSTPPFAA